MHLIVALRSTKFVSQLTEQFRTQVTERLEVVKQSSGEEGSLFNQMDKVPHCQTEALLSLPCC